MFAHCMMQRKVKTTKLKNKKNKNVYTPGPDKCDQQEFT